MTVIAWDGKTLAADRQRTVYGTPTQVTKIFEINKTGQGRIIFGVAGDSVDCDRYVRYAFGREPKPEDLKDMSVMSIDQHKRIWYADQRLHWALISMDKWAIGSGADYAMGAMAVGADAKRAVEVTCDLDYRCGLGVDVLHHDRIQTAGGVVWQIPAAEGYPRFCVSKALGL